MSSSWRRTSIRRTTNVWWGTWEWCSCKVRISMRTNRKNYWIFSEKNDSVIHWRKSKMISREFLIWYSTIFRITWITFATLQYRTITNQFWISSRTFISWDSTKSRSGRSCLILKHTMSSYNHSNLLISWVQRSSTIRYKKLEEN